MSEIGFVLCQGVIILYMINEMKEEMGSKGAVEKLFGECVMYIYSDLISGQKITCKVSTLFSE